MFRQFFWMTGAIIWAGSVGSFVSVRTLSTELLWSFIVWMIKSSIFIVEQHRVLQNIPYMSHLIGFGFDLWMFFCFVLTWSRIWTCWWCYYYWRCCRCSTEIQLSLLMMMLLLLIQVQTIIPLLILLLMMLMHYWYSY